VVSAGFVRVRHPTRPRGRVGAAPPDRGARRGAC
jgi:hypothetical protein